MPSDSSSPGPLSGVAPPGKEALKRALDAFILSQSGWRKIFACDGGEEGRGADITPEDTTLCGLATMVFSNLLSEITGNPRPKVLVGHDTRPTGTAIADAVVRGLLYAGCSVDYLGVVAIPEIIASAGKVGGVGGFVYATASHNPIGYNGFKFGLAEGGVIGGDHARVLAANFVASVADQTAIDSAHTALSAHLPGFVGVLEAVSSRKKTALQAYTDLVRTTATGGNSRVEIDPLFETLSEQLQKTPLGIVADLNGSARTTSIDEEFLTSIGFKVRVINGVPGEIAHRIVPEGDSLMECTRELERAHSEDPAFQLGYVPDNDGDRGNLVYYDTREGVAKPMEAQEVFALSVLGELAFATSTISGGDPGQDAPLAVAATGPTSLRIDRIASCFGAEVFRSEVGEANVVGLARELRGMGYRVPILGEGSNGGSITYPALVRDPLNTLLSLAKLLLIRGKSGSFHRWCNLSSQIEHYEPGYTLTTIISTLPKYTSTSAYEPEAVIQIGSFDHRMLKEHFEMVFPQMWNEQRENLYRRWGITSWREQNTEGMVSREGSGGEFRTGAQTGGLKIEFLDASDRVVGFIWFRGSGTEPVLRIAAEIEGEDRAGERFLLGWLRKMVENALAR